MGKNHYCPLRDSASDRPRGRSILPLRAIPENMDVDHDFAEDTHYYALEADARDAAFEGYRSQASSVNGSTVDGALGNDGDDGHNSPSASQSSHVGASQVSSMASPINVDQYVLQLRELQASRGLNDKQLEAMLKFNKQWHRTGEYGLPVSLFTLRMMEQNRSYIVGVRYICPKCSGDIDRNELRCRNRTCNFFGHRFGALNCGYGECSIKEQLVRLLQGVCLFSQKYNKLLV